DIKGALILEPLLARKFDFSHYVYPDGKIISYQNLVDRHFQYRGSLFASLQNPTIEKLPFYFQIQQSQWQQFDKALARIRKQWPADHGYSVDSFIYEEAGELYIRYLSEVNYRRTMGATAFELAEKYGAGDWALFVMGKKSPSLNFSEMVYLLSPLRPKVLLLSPDDVRYQMILITADNEF